MTEIAFDVLSCSVSPQQDVDLFLDPVFVVGSVAVGALLVHEA